MNSRAEVAPNALVPGFDIPVRYVRSLRAKRYLLKIRDDGTAQMTIPRRGSQAEAAAFLERSRQWLLARRLQWLARRKLKLPWQDGATLLYRGETVALQVHPQGCAARIRFADQELREVPLVADFRAPIQAHLRRLAERELPARTRELVASFGR